MSELKSLQLLWRFEILAVTETHLDKSISDSEIVTSGMKFVYYISKIYSQVALRQHGQFSGLVRAVIGGLQTT